MPVNSMVILLVCIFAFIPLLMAEIARAKARPTISDFFLQERGLNTFSMYATVFATWMSAFAFMGAISYFYKQGPIYMTTIGWDALLQYCFISWEGESGFMGNAEVISPRQIFFTTFMSRNFWICWLRVLSLHSR